MSPKLSLSHLSAVLLFVAVVVVSISWLLFCFVVFINVFIYSLHITITAPPPPVPPYEHYHCFLCGLKTSVWQIQGEGIQAESGSQKGRLALIQTSQRRGPVRLITRFGHRQTMEP